MGSPVTRPRLSVIMANFNYGHLIGRSIEAMLEQSRQPDELLILDDGSTDCSLRVIEHFARDNPVIRVLVHEQNRGQAEAVDRLLREATGEYLYSASSDDQVLPGFFETAMELAEQFPHAGMLVGKQVGVDLHGNEVFVVESSRLQNGLYASPEQYLRDYLEVEEATHSAGSAVIYKRAALDEVGGYPWELVGWCDSFVQRAIGLRYGACYLPLCCSRWTIHPKSISRSSLRDPTLMLDIARRAELLMLSPQHREVFPREHVRRWKKEFREHVIEEYLDTFCASFDPPYQLLSSGIGSGSAGARLGRHLFWFLLRLQRRLWRYVLGRRLRSYDPS